MVVCFAIGNLLILLFLSTSRSPSDAMDLASRRLFHISGRSLGHETWQASARHKIQLFLILREESMGAAYQQPVRSQRNDPFDATGTCVVNREYSKDDWAHVAGMARRTFMRAFSAQAG